MSTQVLAGTSGYSYKEWRGRFYPPDVHQDQWLTYYASRLPTVEINNTFYRMPRSHVVETWRDSVPASFRFVIKASRRITHQKQLKDAKEPLGYLLASAAILGERLGALLFQLPPYMRANLERLQSFQDLLPEAVPVAFEFRHESWKDPAVGEALGARGHARVVSHEGGEPDAIEPGPLVYLRLRAASYTDAELGDWHERIAAGGAREAFVFFKHEDDAGGPELAERFLSMPGTARAAPKRAARRAGRKAGSAARPAPKAASRRKKPARGRAGSDG
ncbi:MAG: DUF72 domain-containing protein [Pseudomonadales bacterium]